MHNRDKYDYDKAAAELYDIGVRNPEEVYEFSTERGFQSYLREHGLRPERYRRPEQKKPESSNSGHNSACYLTTACATAKGLPDDCVELQTLRAFRDAYLADLPNGQAEINQYYQMAPGVVAAIDQQDNRAEIWNQVYTDLVAPCVRMIHAQENEAAYQLYKAYAMELHKKYEC